MVYSTAYYRSIIRFFSYISVRPTLYKSLLKTLTPISGDGEPILVYLSLFFK